MIQVLLGHSKLDTTALYTQVATNIIGEVMSGRVQEIVSTAWRPLSHASF